MKEREDQYSMGISGFAHLAGRAGRAGFAGRSARIALTGFTIGTGSVIDVSGFHAITRPV
jgi:hypothetical protein